MRNKEKIAHTTIANYGNITFEQWCKELKVSSAYIEQRLFQNEKQDDKQEIRFNNYFKNKQYA